MLWILLFSGVFCLLCAALYAPLTIRHYAIDLSKSLTQESFAQESPARESPESNLGAAPHGAKAPITIALLSDLHSGRIYQREILQALQDKAPDLIALSGDMVDDDEDMAGAWEFFAALAALLPHTPKLYVSGNHEFWSREIVQIKQRLRELGVVVLDFHAPCQRLHIAGQEILAFGVDDPYASAYDEQGRRKAHISLDGVLIDEAQWDRAKWRGGAWEQEWAQLVREHVRPKHCPLGSNKTPESNTLNSSRDFGVDSHVDYPVDSGVDSAPIRILLSHRPEFIKLFTSLPVDLILSGHTHGGQVRIPYLLNGLYAPNQGLFPRFGGGLYKLDSRPLESNTESSKPDSATTSTQNTPYAPQSQYLIISRGLSFNYRLPRVFNPPEVVFITLTR